MLSYERALKHYLVKIIWHSITDFSTEAWFIKSETEKKGKRVYWRINKVIAWCVHISFLSFVCERVCYLFSDLLKETQNNFKENTEQKTMQLQTVSVLCILYILPCCWFSLVSIAMGILDRKWEIYMKRLYTNCSPPFTKYNTLRESFMMYCVVWLTLGKCNPFGLFQV